MEAKALEVVIRTVQSTDLDLTSITRAWVHLPNMQRAAEPLSHGLTDGSAERLDLCVRTRKSEFCYDRRFQDFPKKQSHYFRRRPSALISSSMLRTPIR